MNVICLQAIEFQARRWAVRSGSHAVRSRGLSSDSSSSRQTFCARMSGFLLAIRVQINFIERGDFSQFWLS